MAGVLNSVVVKRLIADPRTRLADLEALRDHVAALLRAQDDLESAVQRLDQDIRQRRKLVRGARVARPKPLKVGRKRGGLVE